MRPCCFVQRTKVIIDLQNTTALYYLSLTQAPPFQLDLSRHPYSNSTKLSKKAIMTALLYLITGLFIGLLLGILGMLVFRKSANPLAEEDYVRKEVHQISTHRIEQLERQLEDKEIECIDLNKALSAQEQILAHQKTQLSQQEQHLKAVQEQLRLEFANTANNLLEEKSEKFTAQNQQQLTSLLAPFKEKLQAFEQKVELFYGDETKQRVSLKEQIRMLTELNQQMSEETRNLTQALKGENKIQGNWGELVLETILEKAGLRKGIEYSTQQLFITETGRRQFPDLILHLPNKKHLIIDSKMSLTAYERFNSAADDEQAELALKEHVQSIRKHVKELSVKNYQQLQQLNSLDFVLMFVPLEAAFILAMRHDPLLFQQAFEQNVILVSPMSLLTTTRTIANVWRYENQSKNALEIAQQAGKMYDKLVGFVDDLDQVGQRIRQLEESYSDAMKKLQFGRGNLIGRAQKLKTLGAKASKTLPAKFDAVQDDVVQDDVVD